MSVAGSSSTDTKVFDGSENVDANWSPTSRNAFKTSYFIGSSYGHYNFLQGKIKYFWLENDAWDPTDLYGTCST